MKTALGGITAGGRGGGDQRGKEEEEEEKDLSSLPLASDGVGVGRHGRGLVRLPAKSAFTPIARRMPAVIFAPSEWAFASSRLHEGPLIRRQAQLATARGGVPVLPKGHVMKDNRLKKGSLVYFSSLERKALRNGVAFAFRLAGRRRRRV